MWADARNGSVVVKDGVACDDLSQAVVVHVCNGGVHEVRQW